MRVALVVVSMSLAACGDPPDPAAPDAAGADAATADTSTLPAWESVETLSNDGQVIVEHVSYRSDGLRVFGRVCRPVASGTYPVAIYNHGGFSGLGVDPTAATCEQVSRFGYVWLGSSYRGEEGSEGAVEVCLGEVTDVLRMLEIALAQPYADPSRVAMWGGSHGGCITLRAVQRGAPVKIAAAVYPPADIARVHRFWKARIAANDPQSSFLQQLVDIVETATGGTPDTAPAAYAARSPGLFVEDLPASVSLLVAHGTADAVVPVSEACALAAAGGFPSHHLDAGQQQVTTPPVGCERSGLMWTAPDPRPSWSGSRYVIAYDGLGHDVAGTVFDAMQADLASFVMSKL